MSTSPQVFEEHGFAPLQAPYLSHWMHTGQRLQFSTDSSSSDSSTAACSSTTQQAGGGSVGQQNRQNNTVPGAPPTTTTTLSVQGLSPSGFLLAWEEGSGQVYELTPDGNSLDMMSGLVRRKL